MIASILLALSATLPVQSTANVQLRPNGQAPARQSVAAQTASRRAKRSQAAHQAALWARLDRRKGSEDFTLGGALTRSRQPILTVAGPKIAPGVFQVQLGDPGTGWQESVIIGVPPVRSGSPVPVLVMFHAYDLSELDCYLNGMDLFEGARNRGWYVIAPLGAHQVNFGIPYAQTNIEYALTYFLDKLPIDRNRIYGAGFSMGGGGVMSYAARHLDPDKPRFAAVVNHTGAVSTANAYWNSNNTFIFDHPATFNGSPSAFPFLYSQSSSMDIDPSTFAVNPLTDLARNLAHVPVLNYHADFDQDLNLVAITQTCFAWLSTIPGLETYLLTPPVAGHRWNTMDENTALNYMGGKTLQTPTTGQHSVLADREAKWFHYYVYQDAPGSFTPFRWTYEYQLNRLTLDQTENLQRVVVDCASLGINTAVNLEVIMRSADGTGEITTLSGYTQPPQQVLRNGLPSSNWSWDPAGKTVTLTESNGAAGALWRVRP